MQTAVGLILARLLEPATFGLVGMVTAVVNFALVFRDLGLSYATVQRAELSDQQLSNLFWLNLGFGGLSGLVLCALAPVLQAFYRVEGIAVVALVLSAAFVLNAAAVQHAALMRRRFQFRALATADVASVTLSGGLAIAVAASGAGVWALLLQQVLRGALFLTIVVRKSRWRPRRFRRGAGTFGHVRFGLEILGFDVVNYLGQNLDKVLIGRAFGAATLGYFTRAQELVLLPISQLRGPMTTAAVPALASADKNPKEYSDGFLLISKINAFVSAPFLVLVALESPVLVPWLLGPQWIPSVPFFQLLALAGLPKTIVGILGTHMIASGQSRRYLWWGSWHGAVLIVGVVVTIPFGALAVAASLVATNALVFVPSVLFVLSGSHIGVRAFMRASLLPVVLSGGSLAATLGLRHVFAPAGVGGAIAEGSAYLLTFGVLSCFDSELRSLVGAGWRHLQAVKVRPAKVDPLLHQQESAGRTDSELEGTRAGGPGPVGSAAISGVGDVSVMPGQDEVS